MTMSMCTQIDIGSYGQKNQQFVHLYCVCINMYMKDVDGEREKEREREREKEISFLTLI